MMSTDSLKLRVMILKCLGEKRKRKREDEGRTGMESILTGWPAIRDSESRVSLEVRGVLLSTRRSSTEDASREGNLMGNLGRVSAETTARTLKGLTGLLATSGAARANPGGTGEAYTEAAATRREERMMVEIMIGYINERW